MEVRSFVGDGWRLADAVADAEAAAAEYIVASNATILSVTTNVVTEQEQDGPGTLYSFIITVVTK